MTDPGVTRATAVCLLASSFAQLMAKAVGDEAAMDCLFEAFVRVVGRMKLPSEEGDAGRLVNGKAN